MQGPFVCLSAERPGLSAMEMGRMQAGTKQTRKPRSGIAAQNETERLLC